MRAIRSAGCARYIASTDMFQVHVKTSKAVTNGSHTLGITVTDGSVTLNSQRTTVTIRP